MDKTSELRPRSTYNYTVDVTYRHVVPEVKDDLATRHQLRLIGNVLDLTKCGQEPTLH